jgi:hypothetical protein
MSFLADLPSEQLTRCYDGFRCPMYAHCRRTDPVPPNVLVSQAFFFAESQQRGGCEHYIERRAA